MYKKSMTLEQVEELACDIESTQGLIVGVRFCSQDLNVGDEIGVSKTNEGREDEREYPVYGTPEYNAMSDLDGACAYNWQTWADHIDVEQCKEDGLRIYLIGGYTSTDGEDIDELIIVNAEVLAVIL